jgi:hypothetical protein
MGGWCRRREDCPNYAAGSGRFVPSERICDRGADGKVRGVPLAFHRPAGSWESAKPWDRRAGPFDYLRRDA